MLLTCVLLSWMALPKQSKWKVFVPAHRFSVVWFKPHSQWQILLGAKHFWFFTWLPFAALCICSFKKKIQKKRVFFSFNPLQYEETSKRCGRWAGGMRTVFLTRLLLTAPLLPTPVGTPQWQQPKKRGYLSTVLSITKYKENTASFRDRGWPGHGAAVHWISGVDFAPWRNACPVDRAQVIKCSSRMCQLLSHCIGGAKVGSFISFVKSNTAYLKLSAGALIFWQVARVWKLWDALDAFSNLLGWAVAVPANLHDAPPRDVVGGGGSNPLLELNIALSQMTSLLRPWRSCCLEIPINSPCLIKCWASPPPHRSGCGSNGQRQSVPSYECPRWHILG